jgi:L-lactate dehydrogenase complex protein LldE
MQISLFVTCLTDLFYPEAAECVVRVLRRLGHRVDFPAAQTCCGQPAINSGFLDEARSVAGRMIDVFDGAETVVTPSGSCCSIVRDYYPRLFEHDRERNARAVAMANKTFEFTELLQKRLKVDWSAWNLRYPAVATFHYSCHNRGIGMTPADILGLLNEFRDLDYRPLEKMEQCCGFGGTFAVKHGDISGSMVQDKIRCIKATGADLVVCNDGGCSMNIGGAARREGLDIEIRHIAELLAEAMSNGRSGGGR